MYAWKTTLIIGYRSWTTRASLFRGDIICRQQHVLLIVQVEQWPAVRSSSITAVPVSVTRERLWTERAAVIRSPTEGWCEHETRRSVIRTPACGTRRTLRPGWRKAPLLRTHAAKGTGSWACCTGSSPTSWTTGSGTRWAWPRALWPSSGSPRHPAGLRWFSTYRTVWAAGRTEGRTARTSAPTSQPTSTRWDGAGWAPGWPAREWSSAFGSRWSRTRSPTCRRLRGGHMPSEMPPRCRRPGETVSVGAIIAQPKAGFTCNFVWQRANITGHKHIWSDGAIKSSYCTAGDKSELPEATELG